MRSFEELASHNSTFFKFFVKITDHNRLVYLNSPFHWGIDNEEVFFKDAFVIGLGIEYKV